MFYQNLKMQIILNKAIPFQGCYPKEKNIITKITCEDMLFGAMFVGAGWGE